MRQLWTILAASSSILWGADPVLDTSPRTYVLFLDMHEVEALHNVELVVNQAEKHPANPVLPTGDMNDFDFAQASTWAGSVIFDEDEQIFKLWYMGGREGLDVLAVGYAWSRDGKARATTTRSTRRMGFIGRSARSRSPAIRTPTSAMCSSMTPTPIRRGESRFTGTRPRVTDRISCTAFRVRSTR